MEIFVLLVVAAVSAGFAVKIMKNGLKTAPKPAPVGIVSQPTSAVHLQKMVILREGMTVSLFFAQQWVLGEVKKIKGERARMVVAMDGHTRRVRRNVRQLRMV